MDQAKFCSFGKGLCKRSSLANVIGLFGILRNVLLGMFSVLLVFLETMSVVTRRKPNFVQLFGKKLVYSE